MECKMNTYSEQQALQMYNSWKWYKVFGVPVVHIYPESFAQPPRRWVSSNKAAFNV
jgi:hypothetical protein